ncbi:MAG: hypothetical protein QG577_2158, partial [Thermodesulfobacteriota bacterium]|nr:hypothetical protein [Thermodesulfobacteriota bacterium]
MPLVIGCYSWSRTKVAREVSDSQTETQCSNAPCVPSSRSISENKNHAMFSADGSI